MNKKDEQERLNKIAVEKAHANLIELGYTKFKTIYINNVGNVKSIYKDGRIKHRKPKYMGKPGYRYATFTAGSKAYYTHRALWEIFKGPIPPHLVVAHIDGDRLNNSINNLHLITQSEASKKTIHKTRANGGLSERYIPVRCIETGEVFPTITAFSEWIKAQQPHRSLKGIMVALTQWGHTGGYTYERLKKA